jgi:serine/threonine protein kinase
MEKQYDTKVDIWSAGCIFAEFLHVLHTSPNEGSKDRILLPGKSCYPLSPMPQKQQEKGGSDNDDDIQLHISSKDQMKHICRILGTPKTNDKSFITDNTAIDYMNMICEKKHSNKLQSMFPKTSSEIISLVRSMLEFNPHFRITAQEALANPIFDSIR